MKNIMNKLTSRKFILAVIGIISGLAMANGIEGNEIIDMVGKVAGVITAAGVALGYINAEAKVDAAAVKKDGE